MLDFSKIINIVFVSVCAALSLLFLISVIVVAAKGKRKCGVGDVLLRILATLALIVSTVMVACSVLTMLNTVDGSMCIVAVEEKGVATAFLAVGGEITELPLPDLFVTLSTVIGFGLSAVLFMLSLTALIVDCLVANKKEGQKGKKDKKDKKKEPAVKKSPEQLKREAELERIRRIGESAVRKTERVAEKAEKTEKPETTKDEVIEDAQTPSEQVEDEQDTAVDWREQPAEQHSGFVGIKDDNADDSFDSFDTFDGDDETSEETNDYEQPDAAPAEESDEYVDEQSAEESDEYAEQQTDEYTEQTDEYADQQAESDEQPTEDIYYDEDEGYTYDDGAQSSEGDEDEDTFDGEYSAEGDNYEYEQTEGEQPTDEYEQATDEQPIDIGEEVERMLETPTDDIEPDRGIYIPEIRTVTPRPTETPVAVKKAEQKPSVKPTGTRTPKSTKPKKSGGSGTSQRPAIPPEKKLPVTRRYVILDRHNAVNMFGEYLKERNQAEKDKLKSSINTIIIE